MIEALSRMTKNGLVVDIEGWFVLNARESRWKSEGPLGRYCKFEGKRRFPQLGINISVLRPGEAIGRYHRENAQEGFLVIEGECLLIVEEQERRLKAWDYFHCPGGTEHIIVGAGDGPAIVVAVGARGRGIGGGVVYPCPSSRRVTGQASSGRRRTRRGVREITRGCRDRGSCRTSRDRCPAPTDGHGRRIRLGGLSNSGALAGTAGSARRAR